MPSNVRTELRVTMLLASIAIVANIGRGAAALDTSLLPRVNTSFVFDGSHSDVAQQLYHHSRAGDVLPRLNLSRASSSWLPDALRLRLERVNAPSFDALPGLLQRALLWDSGFVVVERRDWRSPAVVQVWTTDGRSMRDLAVSQREWANAETIDTCALTTCTDATTVHYSAVDCACDARAALVAKCAVADTYRVYDDAAPDASAQQPALWATGTDPDIVPDPVLRELSCSDDDSGDDSDTASSSRIIRSSSRASVVSIDTTGVIHTSSREAKCTTSLVVPCLRVARANTTQQMRLREPLASSWVDDWLVAELAPALHNAATLTPTGATMTAPSAKSFDMALLVAIVVGSLFALAVVGLLVVRRDTRAKDTTRGTAGVSSIDGDALLTPRPKSVACEA